jgi:flagellar hook-associated protein 1 FlgK
MGTSILTIGTGALAAAQAGLLTAGHNIANANTAGYSRQRVEFATNVPQYTGSGYVGNGVHVASVRRQYDALLGAELAGAQAQASHSQAYLDQLGRIDALLADSAAGLSGSLDEFFAGVHDVAASPSDPAARQNLVSSANALAARFHELDAQLSTLRRSTNQRITASVDEINTLASQVAQLNRQILAGSTTGAQAQPPNDLLDQRDQLVAELSQKARVSVVVADNGDYDVFLANGQTLVQRDHAFALTVRQDPLDAENVQVGLQTGATLIVYRPEDLAGGELGGLLAFRGQALDVAQNSLGRLALALGAAFNAQHRLGLDANGAPGADFFAIGGPQVLTASAATLTASVADYGQLAASDYRLAYDGANYTLTRLADGTQTTFAGFPQTVDGLTLTLGGAPAAGDSFLIRPVRDGASALRVLVSDASRVAAAAPVRTAASTANTGGATISAGSVDASYPATPLGAPVTLTYDAATGTLSGLPATPAFAYVDGGTITWNGISFSISGTPADGDTFTLEPNSGGTGDNRNALALAALQQQPLVGRSTLQQSYAQLVAEVGYRTREQQAASASQQGLVTQIAAARDAVSGVNLDEEAADLLRYQQAYMAAARMIQIAASVFDSLLDIGR